MDALRRECEVVNRYWSITALPGVELTHIPAASIPEVARRARAAGAAVVNVHGETVVEPVEPGTNRAAVDCEEVDVLAHPGLLDPEDAARAAARGCFIEVSAAQGHGFANGHVVRTALAAGAALLLDSDAHEPGGPAQPRVRPHRPARRRPARVRSCRACWSWQSPATPRRRVKAGGRWGAPTGNVQV